MNNIDFTPPFDTTLIDYENYTASLLQLCSQYSVISKSAQMKILFDLNAEFIETANQYTKRESSTISKKRGELIYLSILYQSDIYLLSLKSVKKSIDALSSMNIIEILNNGKRLIMHYFEESKLIFKRAYKSKLDIPIYEYNYALNKAFDEFCVNYSARFDAINIFTTIDYPLLNFKPYEIPEKGVLYIKKYYTALMLENEFCTMFDISEIKTILEGYGKIYGCKYTHLLFNVMQVILNNYLTRLILGENGFSVKLNFNSIAKLYGKFCEMSQQYLYSRVCSSFAGCIKSLNSPMFTMYIKEYIPKFSNELFQHIASKNVDKMLVV